MIFNDNNISVVCTKYEPFKKKNIIEVEAEKSFKLKVITKYLWDTVEIDVPKGKSTFKI